MSTRMERSPYREVHANGKRSPGTSLLFYGEDNEPTSAGYTEHRYATDITSLGAVLAIKGSRIQG